MYSHWQEQTISEHRFQTRQLDPQHVTGTPWTDRCRRSDISFTTCARMQSVVFPPHHLSCVNSCSLLQSLYSPLGTREKQNTAHSNYTFLASLISLFPCGFLPMYIKLYNMPLFFFSGGICVRVEWERTWLLIIIVWNPVEYQRDKIVVVLSCACLFFDRIDVRYLVSVYVIKVTSSVLQNTVGYSMK